MPFPEADLESRAEIKASMMDNGQMFWHLIKGKLES